MFPNRDPKKIRPLEEEMADVGLNPERTLGAMERSFGMLVQGSLPPDASGLKQEEGASVPRSIHEVGQALREDAEQPPVDEASGDEPSPVDQVVAAAMEGEGVPEGIVISEEELQEAFKIIRKMIKTASEKMQAKRAYRKVRSKARKYAKQYYKRFKRKISKVRKRLRKRFGGEAGLKKARAGGKKRISTKMSGLDMISNLREELEQAEARMAEAAAEPEAPEAQDPPVTPYEEAAIKAGLLLMYIGECFEEVDVDSAAAMFDLSDGAADIAEELMGVEVVDEETEQRLESLFIATARAMKAHHEVGSPTAMDVIEAVEIVGSFLAENDLDEGDAITEADETRFEKLSGELEKKGATDPDALAAWIGRKKYGKEKMAKMAAKGRKEDVEDVEEGDGAGDAEGAEE